MKPAALATICFLLLIAAAHVARIALGVEVVAGGEVIPMWTSVFAVVVLAALATWLWREQKA